MDKTKAALFLMNEAKRNALGKDFGLGNGSQYPWILKAIYSLGMHGISIDAYSDNGFSIESGTEAEQAINSCGYTLELGQKLEVVQNPNDFLMTDPIESFVGSGIKDSKGREIGWVVGLRNDGINFYAWVQNARSFNYNFSDFGVKQKSVCFTSQEEATRWAYTTAKQRVANFRKENGHGSQRHNG